VNTKIYGKTAIASLQALHKLYSSRHDFVILWLDWQTCGTGETRCYRNTESDSDVEVFFGEIYPLDAA
jgi:hypothetical protein